MSCPALISTNECADRLATDAATKKIPTVGIRILTGIERVICLYKGHQIDNNPGDALRKAALDEIEEKYSKRWKSEPLRNLYGEEVESQFLDVTLYRQVKFPNRKLRDLIEMMLSIWQGYHGTLARMGCLAGNPTCCPLCNMEFRGKGTAAVIFLQTANNQRL